MSSNRSQAWMDIKKEVIRRINERIWLPDDTIPTEIELAAEFGCSRATVNKALRELAEAGLLDRRRKSGTRIIRNPVRKATLEIAVIRKEVEENGDVYRHLPLSVLTEKPGKPLAKRLGVAPDIPMMHLKALHLANNKPFAFEDRWINLAAVPEISEVDLGLISANEWLVNHAPFTHGDITFSASNANMEEAEYLSTDKGIAVFIVNRATWNGPDAITSVHLAYAPGYRMHTHL